MPFTRARSSRMPGFGTRLPLDDILFENGWPDGAGPTPSAY
ncbi:hypothetical protein LHK_02396 [Laribacter hongkongensis HLHK9]|uniref:Uncharacterized protein n=1 Tax=Laribacter hongkongensis (strain HLHK9) TaxID=557598 RepID=C1DB39_LARHH|nr:hypothetical protein LHK_02396 [Laribacter hongkongensis HLHK9]